MMYVQRRLVYFLMIIQTLKHLSASLKITTTLQVQRPKNMKMAFMFLQVLL